VDSKKGNHMLVLTRKRNEKIIIGAAVVTVLKSSASCVTLGIDAPKDILILRAELDTPNAIATKTGTHHDTLEQAV